MDQVTPSQIIHWLVMVIGLAGVWFRSQFKIERLDEKSMDDKKLQLEENNKIWDQIGKRREWEDQHDRETNRKREEYDRELSRLRENIGIKDGKLDAILNMVTDIKKNMDDQIREMNKRIERVENRD